MSEPADFGEAARGPEAAPRRLPSRVLEFFFFPLVMVAVGVGVFVLFGLITAEGKAPRDYLGLIRNGDSNRRWQAAFELSKVIASRKDLARSDPDLAAEMVSLFQEASADDPRVRRFLALALGRLGDARAAPALVEYLGGVRRGEGDSDSETHIYATWALGALGDPSAVPELAVLSTHDDAGLRKTAVHALRVFPSSEATAALERALDDPAGDVRWNAAAALARRGDGAAVPVLEEMLDRDQLARVEGITPGQVEGILLQAISGAVLLPDPRLGSRLEALGSTDPSLKVRAAARQGLALRADRLP